MGIQDMGIQQGTDRNLLRHRDSGRQHRQRTKCTATVTLAPWLAESGEEAPEVLANIVLTLGDSIVLISFEPSFGSCLESM